MREILFRGKRADDGEWVYGHYVHQYGADMIYLPDGVDREYGFDYYHINPETIGQYTGLTDKNGTKIFEGDILNCYSANGINDFRNRVVEWSELFLCFKAGTSPLYGDKLQDYEIIGNIHDNPELLKECGGK